MEQNAQVKRDTFAPAKRLIGAIPEEIRYVLLLFIGTRIALTGIGLLVCGFMGQHVEQPMSSFLFLNVWGVWDSYHYVTIALTGYSASPLWAFFPFYPLLMSALTLVIGNAFISGLIVSNACLLIASIFLYKLVMLDAKEKKYALNSVKYMYLYPTAFILSGALTESLYLALMLAGFYYAKKRQWWVAGVLGALLSATRVIGVFFTLPMLYEYAKSKDFKLQKIGLDLIPVLLMPAGLFCYMAYQFFMVGDPLMFSHVQTAIWGRQESNPILIVIQGLMQAKMNALIAIACLAFITIFYKKIGFSYWLVGVYSIVVPLFMGIAAMHRFSLVVFPIYIILAKLSDNKYVDQFAPILLALVQGALMVLWTCELAIE